MLNFLKSAFSKAPSLSDAESVVEEFARQDVRAYPFDLKNFNAGVTFLSSDVQTQHTIVMAMLSWLEDHPLRPYPIVDQKTWQQGWKMRQVFFHMLKRRLPFTEQDVTALLSWSAEQASQPVYIYLSGIPQMIKVAGDFLKNNPLSSELHRAVERLVRSIESQPVSVEHRRWVLRLKELMEDDEVSLPIQNGDVWADAALSELRTLDAKTQTAWAELLLNCLRTTGSSPSGKWLKGAEKHLEIIGTESFFKSLVHWFALVDTPREASAQRYDNRLTFIAVNVDILKGLAWLCSTTDNSGVARALSALAISAYRKIPGVGPRAAKVGNACFWALGNMPGSEGVAQLSILKLRIKTNTAQRQIANALETAASRLGMSASEIEEMSVPTYGMDEVGVRRDDFGEFLSEIRVDGSDVEQAWLRKDGKRLASAPKAIKEGYPAEFKEISGAVKDIRKMLPAQRDRIDNLFLLQKRWTLASWQAHYLNHPLVGT
ncbi:MAG: DUF4132 domain-containing protein, partial [Chloroflexota bacterium]|nr:DUF4132 domain-containing protein [Chloroflexota bacterium]